MFRICLLSIFIYLLQWKYIDAQHHYEYERQVKNMIWCTKSLEEQYKCQNLTVAIERDRAIFDDAYLNLTCFLGYSADECIHHIDHEKAHVTTLDAGDVFTAGRYNSLVPIMQEKFTGGLANYHAVAVVKKDTLQDVYSLRELRNKRACFPWVGSMAGWIVPIYTLQREGGMEVVDCNNQVKTAANYFNNSCAVYSLINKYNPIGDNSDKLCTLCTGKIPGGRCTARDPYYGYDGAFRCLLEAGEVAFLRDSTVMEMLQTNEFGSLSPDRFELLCRDGRRVAVSEYRQCHWGVIPSDAVVTSSARNSFERKKFQQFLRRVIELYSDALREEAKEQSIRLNGEAGNNFNYNTNNNDQYGNTYGGNNNNQYNSNNPYDTSNAYNRNPYDKFDNGNSGFRNDRLDSSFTTDRNYPEGTNETILYEKFRIFESRRHGKANLMFQDSARSLLVIPEDDQSFSKYLQSTTTYIYGIRDCPVPSMTLCVTSDPELEKCIKMKIALKAQILKPELICKKMHSHINCMQWIQSGKADIAVFDAGDVYTGGLNYELIPFMSEVYNLGEPEYYVVAVAKEEDPDTELTYLKGKYTCHTGINTAAGWTYPMAFLISNGWIRPYGCDSVRAAAEYFTKSCLPGAISNEYNTGVPYDSMCDLCHGTSYRYCRRDASEDYYGHTGAFRCLVEGGGHVAFMKHTTVMESTGGKRKEWWARNALNDDFELLCTDGTRAELHDYKKCNLGKVKANAIVTRGGVNYNQTQINAYINLLTYAQQLYGRKNLDTFSFSMFSSPMGYYDLIFQDATRQLRVIPPNQRRYDTYLGSNFMRARRITDCYAGAAQLMVSLPLFFMICAFLLGF
ncbi:melanotransferrin [Zeugodacus cucurbitae]|uniref:Melanotransferrin n=1 Tax=Zeugodacus cucurbitae TaxID=28588 RepID=A0A0A1XGX6_ZEUCU|nr:melanotransferrin [Zeugodacus cucurbitae]XP_011195998.1 melanotransferrin [Zeugodacus cucurbitae]